MFGFIKSVILEIFEPLFDIIFGKSFGRRLRDMKINRRAFVSTIVGGGVVGGAGFSYALFVEPYRIQVARYTIAAANLPAAFDGAKIAFVCDTHYGNRSLYNHLERTVQLVQQQSPDLIILGGDYCDNENDEAIQYCFSIFRQFSAPLGVFGILGNHDFKRSETLTAMRDVGIYPLVNRSVWLARNNSRILLGGLDDLWIGRPSFAPMQRRIRNSTFTIIASHNPDVADDLTNENKNKIDLVLSGHSHGGQLTFFGLYAPISVVKRKYLTGLVKPFDNAKVQVIISNGVGTTSVPLRFFAPPQIVLTTLKKIDG
jgi:predicted MPP superfamily phosphohydrolase